MKILRIIYDWPEPWVGLSPHPYELTVAQEKLGHDITVFAGQWPRAGEMKIPEGVTVKGFIREPFKGTLNLTTSVLLFSHYLKWRKENKPDIIHAHGHFGIWIYLYRLFLKRFFKNAKELQIPLVVHFHNTVEGRKQKLLDKGATISPISKNLSWPLAKKSDEWAIKAADACIFVSAELKKEAIEYYDCLEGKSFVIASGVNDSVFRPVGEEEKEKTRKDLGLDLYDKVVINYGMMVERKGIHFLVESLAHLPEKYKLLLVGPGDTEYLEKLNEIIEQHKLASRIVRVGYTPYPQIPIALQSADIFVLPSAFEGSPKVVMESLSCGIPCLVSGFEVPGDIQGVYYLKDREPETIATEIQRLLESGAGVDRNKVHQLFSWDMRAQKMEKVYEFARKNKS